MIDKDRIGDKHVASIKSEAFLVEQNYQSLLADDPLIYPNGGFRRAYRNDIEQVHPDDQNPLKIKRRVLELNRVGLYDSFPELLFHKSKKPKQFKNIRDLREERQYNNEIERNTRRFFWPLDHYLIKMKCHIYAHESGKTSPDRTSSTKSLQIFWGVPSFFEKQQIALLCKMMPYAKEIAMNIKWMEQTVKLLLNVEVKIEKTMRRLQFELNSAGKILGNAFLGNNSIIGSNFRVSKYILNVALGPLSKNAANGFAQGESDQKRLNFILETFVPLDFTVKQEILLNSDSNIYLHAEKEESNILGLTSTI